MFRKTKSAPADLQKSSKRRRFRRKKSAPSPTKSAATLKMMEWGAISAERWAIAKAKIQEKGEHAWTRMRQKWFACTHCIHPFRRRAARQAAEHDQLRATENRVQKETNARSKAAAKRIEITEARMDRRLAKQGDSEATRLLSE